VHPYAYYPWSSSIELPRSVTLTNFSSHPHSHELTQSVDPSCSGTPYIWAFTGGTLPHTHPLPHSLSQNLYPSIAAPQCSKLSHYVSFNPKISQTSHGVPPGRAHFVPSTSAVALYLNAVISQGNSSTGPDQRNVVNQAVSAVLCYVPFLEVFKARLDGALSNPV